MKITRSSSVATPCGKCGSCRVTRFFLRVQVISSGSGPRGSKKVTFSDFLSYDRLLWIEEKKWSEEKENNTYELPIWMAHYSRTFYKLTLKLEH